MKYILAPLHNWMTCFEAGVTQSPREASFRETPSLWKNRLKKLSPQKN